MRKIYKILICSFLTIFMCFITTLFGGGKVMAATSKVHLIVTTPGEDASTQININYHSSVENTTIEYTLASDTEFANALTVTPQSTLWSIKGAKNADEKDSFYKTPRYVCSASLTDLQPRTKYMYRIAVDGEYSDIYHFTTAGLTNDWNFVAFADFQYGKNKVSHNLISKMRQIGNNAPLVVCSGDMVDVAGAEDEWKWFLDNPIFKDFVYATAPGDHEYWASYYNSDAKNFESPITYNALFNNPKNGSAQAINSNFYFHYNNVLFIMLDMLDSDTVSSAKMTQEISWFKTTVKELEGTFQYLVVLGHKSLYSSYNNDSRVNQTMRPQWYPVFDECGVDLVISGHDHMYSRTFKLYDGKVTSNSAKERKLGTYYLDMGSSGDKTRVPDDRLYTDGLHETVLDLSGLGYSCGTNVTVSNQTMIVQVYNQNGVIVDSFTVFPKRNPLSLNLDGFDQDELLDNTTLTLPTSSTLPGHLEFKDGEMLKYIKHVRVLSGENVFLDTDVNYNLLTYNYPVPNMDKINYVIEFTLNDGNKINKEYSCDYWKASGVKLTDEEKLLLTWNSTISQFNGYSWKLYVDNTLIKELNSDDLAVNAYELPNEYLINDHEIKLELIQDNQVINSYDLSHEGCDPLTLTSEEINLKVGESLPLAFDFYFDNLVKIKISDQSIASYANDMVTALKVGQTEITFKIEGTDLSYKCIVNVTKGGGCSNKDVSQLTSLITLLAVALIVRKRKY